MLVSGNEAVAWAAAAAGVSYVAHYPGSPVTGIAPALRTLARERRLSIAFNDALNEHVAALAAIGASLCGARSLLVMKHVGLNVAADPLSYAAYAGPRGGLVVVVGTDPGANQSTGEEDVHWYASLFGAPLYEPTGVASAFRLVGEAFEASERYGLPVLVFLPVRICSSFDFLQAPTLPLPPPRFRFEKDPSRYVNVGQRAVRNHRRAVDRLDALAAEGGGATASFEPGAAVGLVTRGLTFGHVSEAVERLGLERRVALLNVERVHPLPRRTVLDFLRARTEALVVEDQDGFLECQIKAQLFNDLSCRIDGKDDFPRWGEVGIEDVERVLARRFGLRRPTPRRIAAEVEVPERLGAFCEGCPHRGAFYGLERALEGRDAVVGGDIGCSSLPPFRADWLLCMNAGIGLAQGIAQVTDQLVVSTGGEGSFFHAGLVSLQSAVQNGIDLLHVVFDNGSIAMTGHQRSPTTPGGTVAALDVRRLLAAVGVDRVVEVPANRPTELAARVRAELDGKGVRVVWVRGECARRAGPFRQLVRRTRALSITAARCGACTECHGRLGCPAIQPADAVTGGHLVPSAFVEGTSRPPGPPLAPAQPRAGGPPLVTAGFRVDPERCARCGTCLDVCPNGGMRSALTCSPAELVGHVATYLRARAAGVS